MVTVECDVGDASDDKWGVRANVKMRMRMKMVAVRTKSAHFSFEYLRARTHTHLSSIHFMLAPAAKCATTPLALPRHAASNKR